MRILAASDLHCDPAACDALVAAGAGADLVLGAGDFASAHRGLAATMARLAPLDGRAVHVPGNNETPAALRAATGARVLHGEAAEVGGLVIVGLGGAVPNLEAPGWESYGMTEAEAEAALAPFDRCDVLLCHSPPKGIADVFGPMGSIGSTALRAAALRLRPRLMLFGHVHDAWGQEGRIGPTLCRNLGPRPTWFDLDP